MALQASFHSVDEILKPPNKRVYHNNDNCQSARDVPSPERQSGTGGYRQCKDCERLEKRDR